MDDPAGLLGSWFAARSADNMKEERTGKVSTAARDGVAKVAPLVGMTAATGLAAGNLAASAPEAVAGVTDAVTSFVPTGTLRQTLSEEFWGSSSRRL